MDPVSEKQSLTPAQDDAVNRAVGQLEWWSLLRSALPLIAAGIGVAIMYAGMATGEGAMREFWIGPPLALAGSLCALIGYVGRLREIRRSGEPNTRYYPWLFVGWVLVAAGALIPPYSAA